MRQEVRFCQVPGGRVASATVGDGPPLVLAPWWISHIELDWERPDFRAFVEALARDRTVLRYDPLGTGLSDRTDAEHGGLAAVRAHWGLGSRLLADVFLPEATAAELEAFARFQRDAASAQAAAEHLGFVYSVDVREDLPRVQAPTLVLHRRDDRAIAYD